MNHLITLNNFNYLNYVPPINYLTFCLFFYLSILLFSFSCSPPIKFFDPIVTQYFGKLTYLTYQGNYLILSFFFIAFYNSLYKNNFFTYLISYLYPLVLSLSFFITIGFYLLDYTNPVQIRKRANLADIFPYLHITCHTDHFFAFPLVVFFGYHYPIQHIQNNFLVIKYSISYVIFMFLNKYLTKAWTYPIIVDIELKYGFLGRNLFFIFLIGFMNIVGQNYRLLI